MYVAVAGGTGWIGRLVVGAVRTNGDTPMCWPGPQGST